MSDTGKKVVLRHCRGEGVFLYHFQCLHTCWPHLIVQIQVVKLPICPEVLSVSVQSEVDVPTVALNHHRVPVIVIQEAASGHRGMTQDRAVLIAACDHITHYINISQNTDIDQCK